MMKKFLKEIGFLTLPLLLTACLLEVLIQNIPNDYSLKKSYLDKNAAQIETLILGSSHSFYGLDPSFFFSKTFNGSHISQSLKYDLEILKKYESNFKNLTAVVLPISYFSLSEKLENGIESWRVKNYNIYYEIPTSNAYSDCSEVLSVKLSKNLYRLFSYYTKKTSAITCSHLGWGSKYKSENALDLIESGKKAAQRHSAYQYQKTFDENVAVLNGIEQWCTERNVRLVLFTPPAFESYQKYLDKKQLNATVEIAQKKALANENCTYLNLLNDTRFKAKDYYDADHLSEIGAKKLSLLIDKEMPNLN
jgi:hypothetical protein